MNTSESKTEFNRESILEENRLLSEVAESYRKELEAMRAGRPSLKTEEKSTGRNAYIILGGVALLSTMSPLPEHIRTALYGICVSLAVLLMIVRRPRTPEITLAELDLPECHDENWRETGGASYTYVGKWKGPFTVACDPYSPDKIFLEYKSPVTNRTSAVALYQEESRNKFAQQSLAVHVRRIYEFQSRRALGEKLNPSRPKEFEEQTKPHQELKVQAAKPEPPSPTPRILVDGVLMPTVDDTEWKYEKTITDRSHVHYSYVYTMWNHEIGIANTNTKGVFRLFVRQANGRLSSEIVDTTSAMHKHCDAIWEFQKEAIRLRVHADRMEELAEAQQKTLVKPHQ